MEDLEDLEGDDLDADTEKTLEKGDLFEVKGIIYEVTNASEKSPTAECIGSASDKSRTIVIPAKATYEDTDYKVTGNAKKVTVKVPANVKSKYKKMLKSAGLGKR